ncbi:ATP-binding protein [Aestuariibacter sp. AA17]|uniref:ATP-binding protein n=1 Tax=Fluctibacter corallii TaxID=2984329 RepID=A0ABT3A8F9_9ALTE|nr:ATP-binding protein [Aestuariibacter sp. AA17]MCV2884961.1 ATP-binding protein [Aestuariibacter sp. AA17]
MPGLHRIILIDTHLPGVVELKLNGHTNICGTNASGKTTLQRLIPVFYGEYPSRVVPATRDSFEKWYLPRESSFIIYEYARFEGDLCQVVLASSGSGVNYRFIGKPFELEDYLYKNNQGDHSSVTMNELARNVKRANIMVTNLLNTKEFRAILQNDRTVLNQSANNRELLGYAKVFSLCENNTHLRHIEKLAKAVHSKEGKMETIKAMIAAILEEDGVQPPSSSLSRNRVEDWIRECHLIKEFDAIRPEFTKLEQAHHELEQGEKRLAEIKHLLSKDANTLAALILSRQSELEDVIHEVKKSESQWTQLRDELNQQLSSAKGDIKKYENDLQGVEDEFDHWQSQNIDTHKKNLQQLPQWQSELDTLNTRYALLTEKHQDIDAAYNKRKADISEKLTQELEIYNEEKAELRETLATQQQDAQRAIQNVKAEFQSQLSHIDQEYKQQLNELKIKHAELSSALKNAGYSEFEQSQLDLLDAAIKEASIHEDTARETLRHAQNALQSALKARQNALTALEQTRREHRERELDVEKVEALLYPGEGSVLEFLRKEKPDWETTLGKVIHPDLLSRTDLKPRHDDNQDTVFGLSLDLTAVNTPEYANTEQALQSKLAEAQRALEVALEAQSDAELALAKASEVVSKAELQQSRVESECKTAQTNRKRAQLDKDQVQKEYAQALAERKQQGKGLVAKNETEQKNCQANHALAIQEVRDQQRESETETQFHWQQLTGDTEDKIAIVEQHILKAKQTAQQDKKQSDEWLENELNNRGVDVDEIGALQKQVSGLKNDIQVTEAHRNKVRDYERWYDVVFTGHKVSWQQALKGAKQQASQAERELAKHEAQYKQSRQDNKDKQTALEAELKTAKEQEIDAQTLLKGLTKLTLPTADMVESNATVGQRISEGQSLLQNRERQLADIKAYVEHFDQLIAAQAGTGLSDTWERAREECAVTTSQGIRSVDHRRLVSHLAQLLNVIVPQKLNGLREQGRIFGADLTQYYNVLEDIDKRIASQSQRISKEVDQELFLDGVSESSVRIRSKISELEFWPELAAFNRLYQKWMASGAAELPSEDYAQSMRRVLDILGRAALTGGISKLLDIELHMFEGKSELFIRTDRQLNESSSHGMAYLILCKFLLAFTRLLRGDANATIHWPIDELGTLHQSNVKKIFDACQNNNIAVVGAFPNPESDVLTLFDNRYLIDKATRKLQVVQPKTSVISERIKQRKQQASEEVSV